MLERLIHRYSLAVLIGIAFFVLYLYTLTPTILWGDQANIPILVYKFHLGIGGSDHPLYIIIAKLFALLPIKNFAFKINLMSAFFGSATLVVLYFILLAEIRSVSAAVFSIVSLGLSHAFWWYSVAAKAYSLHLFFIAIEILILIYWRRNRKDVLLYAFIFILGLAFSNNYTIIYSLPGFVYFILAVDYKAIFRLKKIPSFLLFLLLGFALFIVLFYFSLRNSTFEQTFASLYGGKRGTETFFVFSASHLTKEPLLFLGYLFYQFPVIGIIFGFKGIAKLFNEDKKMFNLSIIVLLVNGLMVLFSINNYKFGAYLPVYFLFSIFIGYGYKELLNRGMFKKIRTQIILFSLIIILPLGLYNTFPVILKKLQIDIFSIRNLPYREKYSYYLNPAKGRYYGAYRYGKQALVAMKDNSLIIADFSTFAVLNYLQTVEGVRQDVKIICTEQLLNKSPSNGIMNFVNENIGKRAIYFGYNNNEDYQTDLISNKYRIVPVYPIFKIEEK